MATSSPGFRKEMTLLDLFMASMGAIIGSGWLFGAERAAHLAGPAAVISWIIGGIAVLLIGLAYAELGGMVPEAGALVRMPQYSHGTLVSLLMGWTAWITYAAVVSIEAEAVVQYANNYIPGLYDTHTGVLTAGGLVLAAILLVVFFILNYLGVQVFARVNTVVTAIKFIMPALTLLVLLIGAFKAANFSAHGGFAPAGTNGVLKAVSTAGVVFAYLGFRQAIDMAGEARNPQRDVPRALLLAICAGIGLYVLLQIAFIGAVPGADIVGGWGKLNLAAPYVDLAQALGFGWLAFLLLVDAALSPAGTGFVYTGTNARVAYALTKNGYFPEPLARIHPRFKIPHVALITNLIIGILFLLPFPSWAKLVGVVTDGVVITYIAGPVAALSLRRLVPNAHRPIRIGGLDIIAPIAFVIAGLIIFWSGWPTVGQVLILALVGILFYAYYYPQRHFPAEHFKAAVWLIAYYLFLIVVSYLGSFGGRNALPYPWDMLVVIIGSVIAFYWGVNSAILTEESKALPES